MTEEKKLDWEELTKEAGFELKEGEEGSGEKKNYLSTKNFEVGPEYIYQLVSITTGVDNTHPDPKYRKEVVEYIWIGEDGVEYTLQSDSKPIFFALKIAELTTGDWFKLTRLGLSLDTRYKAEKIEG